MIDVKELSGFKTFASWNKIYFIQKESKSFAFPLKDKSNNASGRYNYLVIYIIVWKPPV
jgi:hypothetical protein